MNLKDKKNNFFFGVNDSLLNNSWIKNNPDKRLSMHISQKYSLTNVISDFLSVRSININKIKEFLEPSLDYYLPNPIIFNDLKKGAERVLTAIKKKRKYCNFR